MAEPVSMLTRNERKWSKALMSAGWTAFPSILLEKQQALGLTPIDVNIILHIASHWWDPDRLPFPGKRRIAESVGVHPRTIQRRIAALESGGLIKRKERIHPRYGRQSNEYDLSGLIKCATPFAEEAIKAKRAAHKEKTERRRRRRPA